MITAATGPAAEISMVPVSVKADEGDTCQKRR
jgi:hypothetical protein